MDDKMKLWGFELEECIREGEPDKAARADAWQTAIGLQAVDRLEPSRFLEAFFGNLLLGEDNELKNQFIHLD